MKLVARIINTEGLTEKEAEVLRHLCEGRMRAEIAVRIHRTLSTVSRHIESIAQKWDAHSAAEIVSLAVAKGHIEIRIEPSDQRTAMLKCLIIAMLINPNTTDIRQPPRSSRQSVKLFRTRTETQSARSRL
jgi:DNA-binding CsgD family transcriptional regulator